MYILYKFVIRKLSKETYIGKNLYKDIELMDVYFIYS